VDNSFLESPYTKKGAFDICYSNKILYMQG